MSRTFQAAYEESRARFKRGDFDGALALVREAIAIDPTSVAARNFEGWVLLERDDRSPADLDAAVEAFREALRLAPSDPVAFANLCDALVAAGRDSEALAATARAQNDASLDAVAHNWLGWYFTDKGQLDRGLRHLREATRKRPSWGVAALNLARALDRAGEEREAWLAYDHAASCGDSHDPKLARRRRSEIGKAMLARGEELPYLPPSGMDGEPLGPEYVAIDKACAGHRFEEAIDRLEALARTDPMARIYTMGMMEHAAEAAHSAGQLDLAKALADLAERGYVDYAASSSSGAEGLGRSYDLEQARKRLRRFR